MSPIDRCDHIMDLIDEVLATSEIRRHADDEPRRPGHPARRPHEEQA